MAVSARTNGPSCSRSSPRWRSTIWSGLCMHQRLTSTNRLSITFHAVSWVVAVDAVGVRNFQFMYGCRQPSLSQFAHDFDQVRLSLEADAGQFGHSDVPVLDTHAVRE